MIDILHVEEFMINNGMHPDVICMKTQTEIFLEEIGKGLQKNAESSLLMIPTYVIPEGEIQPDKRIIVIDAGGTNLRVGLVYFDKEFSPIVEYYEKYPMPGTNGQISFSQMCDEIAEYILPIITRSEYIVLCFSYSTIITPDGDGEVVYFSKEVNISDYKHKSLCKSLSEAVVRKGISAQKKYLVINDTVATMLGGKAGVTHADFDSYIGFILGTGTNTCYSEKTKNIPQINDFYNNTSMIVTLESCGYARFPQGSIDRALDNHSLQPGVMLMEKMTSGGYLGELVYRTVLGACEAGLFTSGFYTRLKELSGFGMPDIGSFCQSPHGNNLIAEIVKENESDKRSLYIIIDLLFRRVAKMVVINLAAIITKTNCGLDPTKPVCISIEGTTIKKSELLYKHINYYISQFIVHELRRNIKFVEVENVTLVGSAVAGLLNLL